MSRFPLAFKRHPQSSIQNLLTVDIPSDYLPQGVSFLFGPTVTTALGGSGEANVPAFKSSQELPVLKVGARGQLKQNYQNIGIGRQIVKSCFKSTARREGF